MALSDAPDPPDALEQGCIAGMPGQRIGRIRGQRREASAANDFGGLPYEARLRLFAVDAEKLCHLPGLQ